MKPMHARPRTITTTIALTAAALLWGCNEDTGSNDELTSIALEYQQVLSGRPIVREQVDLSSRPKLVRDKPDGSAATLRQLAQRTQAVGREGQESAAAVLASGMRSAAATFDFDDALRAESAAASLRQIVRSLAADADLLLAAAEASESFDISDTTLLLESRFEEARGQLDKFDSELTDLRGQTEAVQSERQEHLAKALEFDQTATDLTRQAMETDPISGQDFAYGAAHYRGQAHQARIEAAIKEIAILDLAPELAVTDARRNGASDSVDTVRETRQATEARAEETRAFAAEIRDMLSGMAAATSEAIGEIEALENDEVLPRLEAAIADHEAAVGIARGLSKDDPNTGWRTIANNQMGAGRIHWEVATIHGRRADLMARLARHGVLFDASKASAAAESAIEARKTAIAAAESAFNEALASLANIRGDENSTATVRDTIQRALAGLKGESMASPVGTATGGTTSASGGSSGGAGFATPAEAANFLSDGDNTMSSAAFLRLQSALKADTESGQAIGSMLTAAGVVLPVIDALAAQFGEAEVMAAMEEQGGLGGGMSIGPTGTFTVVSTEGDTATLKNEDGSQTLTLTKTGNGWMIDLDATVEADPQAKMMAQMMGPMLEQMLAPVKKARGQIVERINAGEFATLDDAVAAIEAAMGAAAGGMPGGF